MPKVAVGLMLGQKLKDLARFTGGLWSGCVPVPQLFVKSPVFRFNKLAGVDSPGPEMRSARKVMRYRPPAPPC